MTEFGPRYLEHGCSVFPAHTFPRCTDNMLLYQQIRTEVLVPPGTLHRLACVELPDP